MSTKDFIRRCSSALKASTFLLCSGLVLVAKTTSGSNNEFVISNVRIFDGTHVMPKGHRDTSRWRSTTCGSSKRKHAD
jgi:hypothetical protein